MQWYFHMENEAINYRAMFAKFWQKPVHTCACGYGCVWMCGCACVCSVLLYVLCVCACVCMHIHVDMCVWMCGCACVCVLCFCMCMCVYNSAYVCACVCIDEYGSQRPASSIILQVPCPFCVLKQVPAHWPGLSDRPGCLASSLRGFPVSTPPGLVFLACISWLFIWVIGIDYRSSCLCCKHFTHWVSSPVPQLH